MSATRTRLVSLARILLTAALLAWVIGALRERTDGLGFPDSVGWGHLALAVLLLPANLLFRAWKWLRIVRAVEPRATLGESLRSYLGAMPLTVITPGKVGEFARGMFFPHKSLQGWQASSLVVVDKYTDLLSVTVWAVPGLARIFGPLGLAGGIAAVTILVPLPSLAARLFPATAESGGPIRRILAKAVPARASLSGGRILSLVAVGLGAYAVEWLQFALLVDAFSEVPVPYLPLAGLTAVIILGNALQLTVGGLGVREGLSLLLLTPLGIPPEAAVLAAFANFLLNQLLLAALGLLVKPRALYGAQAAAPVEAPHGA